MKQLIFILTLFSFNALGQGTFTGTYFTTKRDIGFESDIFQFREDGTFNYIFFTCTGRGFGSGNYEVTKDNFLKLQFVNCEECYQTIEIKTEMDSSEFIEIELKIKSLEDDSELPGVHVYFESLKVGVSSDINGDAKLIFPKFDENRTLSIKSMGFDPVNIEVPKQCTKITGIVRLGFYWIYNDEDHKTFKIVNWKDSKLKIKRYPDRTVTYDKVDESKVDSLIKDRIGELDYKLFMEKISK